MVNFSRFPQVTGRKYFLKKFTFRKSFKTSSLASTTSISNEPAKDNVLLSCTAIEETPAAIRFTLNSSTDSTDIQASVGSVSSKSSTISGLTGPFPFLGSSRSRGASSHLVHIRSETGKSGSSKVPSERDTATYNGTKTPTRGKNIMNFYDLRRVSNDSNVMANVLSSYSSSNTCGDGSVVPAYSYDPPVQCTVHTSHIEDPKLEEPSFDKPLFARMKSSKLDTTGKARNAESRKPSLSAARSANRSVSPGAVSLSSGSSS